MDIEEATDVFCRSFAFTRSFTDPFEFVRVGGLRVMRDAVPRREPRAQEIVICGIDPSAALRQIEEYRPPRHFLCVMMSPNDDQGSLKAAYKGAGYRMLSTEEFFVRDLSKPIADSVIEIRRVTTLEDAECVAKAARSRQILPELLGGSEVRLYCVWKGGVPAGWVRSIHLRPESTWASNLFVPARFRRKGFGSALMTTMLQDDLRTGAKYSVLLASSAGAKLYPQLGYDRIGRLMLLSPKR